MPAANATECQQPTLLNAQKFAAELGSDKHETRACEREDGMVLGDDKNLKMRCDRYEESDPESAP